MPFFCRVYLCNSHSHKQKEQCCTFRVFGIVILLETVIIVVLVYSIFSLVTRAASVMSSTEMNMKDIFVA